MSNLKSRRCIQLLMTILFVLLVVSKTDLKAYAATNQTGTVTASKLNIRSNAGTSYSVNGSAVKGTQVTIEKSKKDSAGVKWYRVSTLNGNKKINGYVSSKYVDINESYTYVNRVATVNATVLNIRKTTSTSAEVVAKPVKDTYVTVIGTKTVSGVKWYQVELTQNGKVIRGYAYSQYITLEKITTTSTSYSLGVSKTDYVGMYQKANVYTPFKAKLSKNQDIILLGSIKVGTKTWYRVKAKMNDTNLYGYVDSANVTKLTATVASTDTLRGTVKTKTKAYKIASMTAGKVKTLSVSHVVTVKGTIVVNGVKWYRCNFKVGKTTYTGYIPADCVVLDADAIFEQSLKSFPSTYHSYLKQLHEEYPNWKFKALDTGLTWDDVIANESRTGRNTIQSNVPKGGSTSAYSAPFSYLSTESGAYNWETDTYTLMDGSNWYTANSEVIAYYMDPRNHLTAESIMQFETLAYDENQTLNIVQSILSNTFMNGSFSVVDRLTQQAVKGNYAQTFYDSGKSAGASPYFLAARAKQELGVNGSGSSSGNYPGYEGYYNFYNIGAFDSAGGGAIANGLRWASSGTTYNRPWTTPTKAILGGAQYIASSYINKGQNTGYFQKFNVVYSPYYTHQYMTNVMAAVSEAKTQYNSYKSIGVLDDTMVFYIPVYKNMPSSVCKLPASQGNPNNYLKTLTVKNAKTKLAITPTFNYTTTSYAIVVKSDVESVTIGADAISKYASVSGLGTYQLTSGKTTTVLIKCTAGNGTTKTYTLKISRL